MSIVTIRPAVPADISAIAEVHAASWRATYRGMLPDAYLEGQVGEDLRQQWMDAEITSDDVVLVAEEKGRLIGFIAVWCRPDPYIDNLHIQPGLQSRGQGRALMIAAAEELMRAGRSTATLWVFADNVRAIAFYERLGGVCLERAEKDFFGNPVAAVLIAWSDLKVITD